MATVAERPSRFTVLAELDRRDMITVSAGLSRERVNLAQLLRRSLTRDRAMEFADHNKLTSTHGWTYTSPTRKAHGSEEGKRTLIDNCASTFPKKSAWPPSLKTILSLSRRS
jgi:IS30 family transposase